MRTVNDAGEKIGGSRKDFARARMELADLDTMTDVEKTEHVNKDNVWPKPDYAALAAAGMAVDAAAQVKLIRDRIVKSPSLSRTTPHPTTLAWYVETLSAARDMLLSCKTLADVEKCEGILKERLERRSDPSYYRAEGRARYDILRKGRMPPLYVAWDDRMKVRKLIEQGFPGDAPQWRKGVTVRGVGGSYMLMGTPVVASRLLGRKVVARRDVVIAKGFESEAAALDWLKKAHDAAVAGRDGKPATKKIPNRPHLEGIERHGLADRRSGADVSPQTFIDVFGFRGVEFGEWLPDAERQDVLNLGYDALMDLAEALGMEPGQMSLDGTLAVAFGARGSGSAAAHYESGRRVINMTRIRGAGWLAHEWGHAFDQYLGEGTRHPMKVPSLSGWYDHTPADLAAAHRGGLVASAAKALMSSVTMRPVTRDERVAEISGKIAGFEKSCASWQRGLTAYEAQEGKKTRARLNELSKGLKGQTAGLEAQRARLAKAMTDADHGTTRSNFQTNAIDISGADGYWARPTELFARSFEAFVSDAFDDMGASSDYVVAFADNKYFPPELYKAQPYPEGEERRAIAEAFRSLVDLVAPTITNASTTAPIHEDVTAVRATSLRGQMELAL